MYENLSTYVAFKNRSSFQHIDPSYIFFAWIVRLSATKSDTNILHAIILYLYFETRNDTGKKKWADGRALDVDLRLIETDGIRIETSRLFESSYPY